MSTRFDAPEGDSRHVPVYHHAFRIVQDVLLDPSRDRGLARKNGATLTILGAFEYQTCNDMVCFVPQSVPLSWTIGVKQLDHERAKQP